MKIILTALGSRGDVQPMIALAQRLSARGHQVALLVPSDFEGWIRRLGLAFHDLGVDVQSWLGANVHRLSHHPARIARGLGEFVAEQAYPQFERTAEACRGADMVVVSGLQLAAPSMVDMGASVVRVALQPNLIPSPRHPPPMVPLQLPHAANRALWWATRLFLHHLLLGAVNRGRASIGLPPIRSIDEYLFGETPILLATDPVVAPRDPGWPEHWRQVGYLFFDDPMPLDPELDAWLRDGEPPVYVGFGSMSTPDTARVNREVIEAVSRTGHRGLLGAGWAGLGGDGLPAGWKAIAEAPHHRLFPRCGVVVHHGGSGTTANALRAGAAQVLVPHVLDQFYFAHRLEVCGIAPAPVPVASLRGDRLARAIEAATSTGGDARRAAAERIAAADGVGEAALAVEAAVPHHARSRAVGPSVGR